MYLQAILPSQTHYIKEDFQAKHEAPFVSHSEYFKIR